MYECGWWNIYKIDALVRQHLRESCPYKMPLREERLSEIIKNVRLSGYFQCDIELPVNLQESFRNSPPIFKNVNVGRDDIGPLRKEYAEKEGLLSQPRRMPISSYFLEN